jgi:hypothetical protein
LTVISSKIIEIQVQLPSNFDNVIHGTAINRIFGFESPMH